MTFDDPSSAMAREIAQIPQLARHLLSQGKAIAKAAAQIRAYEPRVAVLCGRGSSGHAGTYLRYLVETRLGLLASEFTPSIVTAYGARPNMRGALFIVISQSGRSPDLLRSAEAARAGGALTLAVVNDARSAVAKACALCIDIAAGPEQAVAATKTVALSMMAGAAVLAEAAHDRDLLGALQRLPDRFAQALECDWSEWADAVAPAPASFVVGRGYALGPVRELALKSAEVLRTPSLGFSSAELRHGPRAAIDCDTPILVLRQQDQTAEANDDLARELREDRTRAFVAGGLDGALPWIGNDHPALDPLAMLLPAYAGIEAAARKCGLDPDRPPHLSKVTETL